MSLNPDFRFSQNNLQDYLDCPRRFELRYILRQAWPALESEPYLEQEQRMEDGQKFHKLVQQYVVGLSEESLQESASSSSTVAGWWANFLQSAPIDDLPLDRYVEYYLCGSLGDYRLAAQYDLLSIEQGKRAVIIDWKTASRRPGRETLKNRVQTRVYRYLLVAAGTQLNGNQPVRPEQVEMVYWFPEFPDQPERFPYDQKQYEADGAFLQSLVAEIASLQPGRFILTADEKKCLFCNYRSLCNRGEVAGDWHEADETPAAEPAAQTALDFEQIGEVEF